MKDLQPDVKCFDFIKKVEGFRYKAYQCSAGVWTIGYGHTENVKPNQTITLQKADILLKQDVSKYANGVKKLVTTNITQNMFNALISFAYNLGLNTLRKSTLLKKINNNDYSVSNEFLKYVLAGGVVKEGLINRRKLEIALFYS